MAEFDRFRSFTERYLIERASMFRAGHEQQDAWLCIQDAKRIYKMIEQASGNSVDPYAELARARGAVAQAMGAPYGQRNEGNATCPPKSEAVGQTGRK